MKPFFTFHIKYRRKDQIERVKSYFATNPGSAYLKCHKEYPSAELLDGWRQSAGNGEHAVTHYRVPSVVRLPAEPQPNEKQETFAFLEEFLPRPKQAGWRWDTPALRPQSSLTQPEN